MVMTDENFKELKLKLGKRLKLMTLRNNLKPSTSQASNILECAIIQSSSNISTGASSYSTETTSISSETSNEISISVIDLFNKTKCYPRVCI